MKLHVLATGTSRGKDLSRFQYDPDFRKATLNMKLGYAALEAIIPSFPKLCTASFVLGSSFGELQTTQDFLATLANQGVARPILFQNSLHNATLGFLALRLGVTGPSVTLSHRYFTGERCLEAASVLIDSGGSLSIVLTVETRVAALEASLLKNYPPQVTLDEGAAVVLVANEATARKLGVRTLAVIESIDLHSEGDEKPSGPYYDSNAIELIVEAVAATSLGDSSKIVPRQLRLNKPDGSYSVVRISPGIAG